MAGILAEKRFNHPGPVLAWVGRIGEASGGAEFDLLRANVVADAAGAQLEDPIQWVEIANRIVDPALRAGSLGRVLSRQARRSEAVRKWMEQRLDENELEGYRQIVGKLSRP